MSGFNLADLFESVVDTAPARLALVAGDRRLSFRDLDDRANRLANHLLSRDLGGTHIGIYAYNRAEWVEALWACFKINAVPVNINYRYVESELRYIVDNADLSALIVESEFAPLAELLAGEVGCLRELLVINDGEESSSLLPDYETALAKQSPERPAVERDGDALYMLYTGGTTGMPKGTLWRHEDIFFGALQGGNPAGEPIHKPEQLVDVVRGNEQPFAALCPAPMMHGGGMWYCMIYLLSGNSFVLYTDRNFDAGKVLELAAREKAINLIVVGDAMARPIADAIATGGYDTSHLVVIGSGGAILSPTVKNQLKRLLPHVMIIDSFGASETGSAGMVLDMDSAESAGPRFTLSENVKVLDEETLEPIPPGSERVGLLAKSGAIPYGYYKDEEKTAKTFQTDARGVRWVVPGDYARVFDDGSIELLGRGSMCINSGGEKIYPEEVEATLKAHPDIFDAGVVGVPDERFGARVVALVSPRPDRKLDTDALVEHCRGELAGYKCPRQWILLENIPRTPAGKPDYRALKRLAENASG